MPAGRARPPSPWCCPPGASVRWRGTDGYFYLYLSGESCALQGAEGFRAGQAVARIIPPAEGEEPPWQVDLYGEDDTPEDGKKARSIPRRRAQFRATKVEMEAYAGGELSELKRPPPPFGLLQRSGFLPRRPPSSGNAAAAARPPRAPALADVQSSVRPPDRVMATSPAGDAGGLPPAATSRPAELAVDLPGVGVATSGPSQPGQSIPSGAGVTPGSILPEDATATGPSSPKRDPMLVPTQLQRNRPASADPGGSAPAPDDSPSTVPSVAQLPPGGTAQPPSIDLAPIEGGPAGVPGIGVPNLTPNPANQLPEIEALPGQPDSGTNEPPPVARPNQGPPAFQIPVTPGTQRVTRIGPRGGRPLDIRRIAVMPDRTEIFVCRGGVNIITNADKLGTVDIEADQAVIWRAPGSKDGEPIQGPNGEWIDDANKQPMEVYLEGNVIIRQDQRQYAGKGDQRTLRATRLLQLPQRSLPGVRRRSSTSSPRACWPPTSSGRRASSSSIP